MEIVFIGNMQFETNEVETIDFVAIAEGGESFGESCLYEHDAYVIPSKYKIKSWCEWYCTDTNGNFVIFDKELQLICGYCYDDEADLLSDYPQAKKMLRLEKCNFEWGKYEDSANNIC